MHVHDCRKERMPPLAKVYIKLIICSGAAVLLFAAGSWSSAGLRQFLDISLSGSHFFDV